MAKGGFNVTTRQLNPDWARKIAKNLKLLKAKEVAVGFPRGGKAASLTYDNGMSVLDVAVVNQFGADINHPGGTPYIKEMTGNGLSSMGGAEYKVRFVKKDDPRAARLPKTKPHRINIPARPFMDQGTEAMIADVKDEMAEVARMANRREISAAQALKNVGAFGEKSIQEAITDGTYEPNAPSTIRKKGSNKPLQGKRGLLRQSVASVVRGRIE